MSTPDLDRPEDVLAYLSQPIRDLSLALDDGISYADTVLATLFETPAEWDPYYWAHAARVRAYQLLSSMNSVDWAIGRRLPNSGIELVRGPIILRALKSLRDGPPNPGHSYARRAFFRQQELQEPLQLVLGLRFGDVKLPSGPNLVIDWTVGEARRLVLHLSKPIGLWDYRGTPHLAWRLPVQIGGDGEPSFVPAAEDIDLDIAIDPAELAGADAG